MTKTALETLRSEIIKRITELGQGSHSGAFSNALAEAMVIVQHEFADFIAAFDIQRPSGNTVTITIVDQDVAKGIMHIDAVYEPKPPQNGELSPAQQLGSEMLQLATPSLTTEFPILPGPRSDQ